MLYRVFGKTGETVSALGVGGSHIGNRPLVSWTNGKVLSPVTRPS